MTRDSFLPFASCCLCLEPAQDPVACPAGDIFCRECALSNILAQKKEMRRLDKARAQEEAERAEQRTRDEAEAQARAVLEFELVQAGLEGTKKRGGTARGVASTTRDAQAPVATAPQPPKLLEAPPGEEDADGKDGKDGRGGRDGDAAQPAAGVKRKFALDDDELQRIADEDRSRARRAIDAERAAARDARALPSFWTPSETPSSAKNGGGGAKEDSATGSSNRKSDAAAAAATSANPANPACPAGRDGHTYSLHTLVAIQFETDAQSQRVCPACNKTLSNASKAVMARPCGHVLCRSCVHKFVRPPGPNGQAALFDPHAAPGTTGRVRCYVCDADLGGDESEKKQKKDRKDKKEKKREKIRPGLVDLRSEGTGFSAGGASEVKKSGVAFQC